MKTPVLDKNFYPMIKALEEYDAKVKKCGKKTEVVLVAERNGGYNYVYRYTAFADGCGEDELNFRIAERLAKTILWVVGGYKISVAGSKKIYEGLKEAYTSAGARAFDVDFMSGVYEAAFRGDLAGGKRNPRAEKLLDARGRLSERLPYRIRRGRKRPKGERGDRRRSRL